MSIPERFENRVELVKLWLKDMTEEERLEFWRKISIEAGYCVRCGVHDPSCTC